MVAGNSYAFRSIKGARGGAVRSESPIAIGLRTRFLLVFIGLAVAPILFVGLFLGHAGYSTVARQSQNALETVSLYVRDNVTFFFEKITRELTLIGTTTEVGKPGFIHHSAALQSLLLGNGVYEDIYLLNPDGDVVDWFSRTTVMAKTDKTSFKDDSIFETPAASLSPHLGRFRIEPSIREPLVSLAVPFADPLTGKLSHMLVANIRFKPVWDLLAEMQHDNGVDAYLIDPAGRVIAHRNPAIAMEGRHISERLRRDGTSPTSGDILSTQQKAMVHDANLAVVVTKERAVAFRFADRFLWTTLVVSLGALAIAVIVFLVYERGLIAPLGRLLTRVNKLRNGDYSTAIDVVGFGEVGILADSFRRLIGDLNSARQKVESSLAELEDKNAQLSGKIEEVKASEARADVANRAKSEFLANMSHELRTPLNAVIGFSEIITMESFGPVGVPEYRSYAQDIHDAGQQLLALINDLLDLAKVESGKDEIHEEAVHFPELVDSTMTLLRQSAERGGVEIDVDCRGDLPRLLVDKRKLQQVMTNLLANAIKFTTNGGKITIRSWVNPEIGFLIQVADTGIGIAAEDIPIALSQFGQVESSMNRKFEGTGLGLPLSKALIELHGGSLELQSEVGAGTTLTICLPASRIELLDKRNA